MMESFSSSGTGPFQAHVSSSAVVLQGGGPGVPMAHTTNGKDARNSPAKVASRIGGNLAELQDLLKAAKSKEVKSFVRENDWPTAHSIRSSLWLELCRQQTSSDGIGASDALSGSTGTGGGNGGGTNGFYAETVDQVFERPDECVHLPSFVDQAYMLTYFLTEKGCASARRVICVINYTHPDITYCPALYPLASLFLHYMNEEDTYNSICALVRSRHARYLHQTKLGWEASWRTVHTLTKKHAKAAFAHLGKFVKTSDQVERLFESWYWWIFKSLPFTHLVRVVDCYLNEGRKVLYRVAIAIILLFAKHTAKMNSVLSQEALKNGLRLAVQKFCEELPVTPCKLLKVAFGIRSLSQKNISNIQLRIEMGMKSRTHVSGPVPVTRSFSTEGMPTSQSQMNIHTTSHTLNLRESARLSHGGRCLSVGVIPFNDFQSQTITSSHLFTLWSWLPTRITMYQPELIYTTEEHGCSLLTFYSRVQNFEPTLLIVKTTNDEIFGAYCSTKWAEKNTKGEMGEKRTYFGTGETFLFTIQPEMKRFPWVALQQDGSTGAMTATATKHSSELFMAADAHMITVGGGNGQAIWIDENVRFGGTSRCDTFDNPPLCESGNFECRVVEVIGFK